MEPRITIVTLGVDDLERSLAFYREGLGLPGQGIVGQEFEYGAVAFFELRGGVRLALFPRGSIARDADVPLGPPSATEMRIAHNVSSTGEVDALMARAERAGARIVGGGRTFWGGYAGYFADPDGHLWEIASTRHTARRLACPRTGLILQLAFAAEEFCDADADQERRRGRRRRGQHRLTGARQYPDTRSIAGDVVLYRWPRLYA